MTNGLVQHITVEESIGIQYVKSRLLFRRDLSSREAYRKLHTILAFLSAIGLKDCRKKIGGIPSHLTLPKIEEVEFIIGVFQNLAGRTVLRADL